MLEGINWGLIAILVGVTMALTEWVKHLSKDKTTGLERLGYWAMAVSMGFGFIVVFIFGTDISAFDWQVFVKMSILVGLGSCGLYNGTTQIGWAVAKGQSVLK